jgi:hypothetical protein
LRREASRRNCELERTRREVGEEELPIVAGRNVLFRGSIWPGEFHLGFLYDGSRSVHNGSADLSGSLIR